MQAYLNYDYCAVRSLDTYTFDYHSHSQWMNVWDNTQRLLNDPHEARIQRRRMKIERVKRTPIYRRYLELVPKTLRTKFMTQTPNPVNIRFRTFAAEMAKWVHNLYKEVGAMEGRSYLKPR